MAETKTAATTEEDAAATKLQAIQRGREARAEVEELKEQTKAATKIQAIQRGKEDRAKVEQLKTEKAAAAATTTGTPATPAAATATAATPAAAAAAADGGAAAAAATPGAGDNAKPKKKKKKKKKKRISMAIMGPPGVGKTAQAELIAKHYDAVMIGSIESILDWVVAEKHECGADVQAARDAGTKIPDATVVQALVERIALDDVKESPAWIVENFPQTRSQMELLLQMAGKKSPLLRFISLRAPVEVLDIHLSDRAAALDEGKSAEEKTVIPDHETMIQVCQEYETNVVGIEALVKENEALKMTYLDIKDASGTLNTIFEQIKTFVGPSPQEDEAAAKLQAMVRGDRERKEVAEREAAAIKIQARIRGKEERDHALKRKDIQNQHEEDEILTALTNSASGTDGKKIQNCFPRSKTKDVLISDLLIKIGKIKSKDAAILTLQPLLQNKKIIELLHRDFKRNDKKNNAVINYTEFEKMVQEHGGKMEERKEMLAKDCVSALKKEFDLRPDQFKEVFDDMSPVDKQGGGGGGGGGGVTLDKFRVALAERAELWGFGDAFSSDRTKEMKIFEPVDTDNDGIISWNEFEAYMNIEKNAKQKANSEAAAIIEEKAKKADAVKKAEEEAIIQKEDEEHECELEILRSKASGKNKSADGISGGAVTENVRRRKNSKQPVKVSDSVAQQRAPRQRRGDGGYGSQSQQSQQSQSQSQQAPAARPPPASMYASQDTTPEDGMGGDRPPMGTPDRKIMLVKILRKYRKGLHTTFEFYSKANIGSVKQFTFDQMREEHSGVNLLMFRRMCGDFRLTHNPRAKFDPRSKAVEEMIRPYITKEEIDAIFRRHAQHLKRISSISHGRGILNEAQFAAAFAQIAVVLLREDPWCDRYPEEWRRVDAIFSRLDVNSNVLLRKRLRGFGGFSKGDGDIGDRAGGAPTVIKPKGFSFNLRLPGDPVTPPPDSSRPRNGRMRESGNGNGNGNRSSPGGDGNGNGNGGGGMDSQKMAQQAADNDDTKMTVSLAAEFGIDDMSGSGNNPYGTTSSAQYGDVTSMLDNLGLTYGLDSSRLGNGNGRGSDGAGGFMGDMESMSWGELDGGGKNGDKSSGGGRGRNGGRNGGKNRNPQRPGGDKPQRQGESPRQRRR